MKSSDTLSKLAPALAKAQAEFRPVGKSGNNTYDKYKYANLEDYVSTVRDILANHGLSVLSSSEEVTALEDRPTKNGGNEHAVRVKLVTRIVHESGEWIETESCGEGQDRADKAVYKAITGARKYALASALNLATTDDPEQDDDHEPPPKRESLPQRAAPASVAQITAQTRQATETVKQLANEHGAVTGEQLAAIPAEWQAKYADARVDVLSAKSREAVVKLTEGWTQLGMPEVVKAALRPLISKRIRVLADEAAQEPAMAGV